MSNNPYKILGVSPNASDEEIKKVYRELVRKYHPDRYTDSDLADLANEKMKEINAAYEEITRMRESCSAAGADFSEKRGNHRSSGEQRGGAYGWQTDTGAQGGSNYRTSNR